MTGEEPNVQSARPRRLWRLLSALLCLAASILTLSALSVDLLNTKVNGSGVTMANTVYAFSVYGTSNVEKDPVPLDYLIGTPIIAVPMVLSMLVLLVAALFGMLADAFPARVRLARGATLTAVGGLVVVGGTCWGLFQESQTWMDRFQSAYGGSPHYYEVHSSLGRGFWFLVAAVVAAVAAVMLAILPIRWRLSDRRRGSTPASASESRTPAGSSGSTG